MAAANWRDLCQDSEYLLNSRLFWRCREMFLSIIVLCSIYMFFNCEAHQHQNLAKYAKNLVSCTRKLEVLILVWATQVHLMPTIHTPNKSVAGFCGSYNNSRYTIIVSQWMTLSAGVWSQLISFRIYFHNKATSTWHNKRNLSRTAIEVGRWWWRSHVVGSVFGGRGN